MSYKKLILGTAVAALFGTAPAFATIDGHPNGNAIYCSDSGDFFSEGGYSEFVHAARTTWVGGTADSDGDDGVGIRINYGGYPAISWAMSVLESSNSYPYVFTEYLYGHTTYYTSDFSGVTVVGLPNGYERWTFDGLHGTLPRGSHFVNIYFGDYGYDYGSFGDQVTNMTVNGVDVVGTHGLTEDCTID